MTGILELLLKYRFTLNSGEDSRPIDEQNKFFRINPLRQLAASFGTPTPDQNKDSFRLGNYFTKELHARGMIAQEGPGWFFAPALTAQSDVRAAGSTDNSAAEPSPAAAAESTQAAMRKQIEDSQRELEAV